MKGSVDTCIGGVGGLVLGVRRGVAFTSGAGSWSEEGGFGTGTGVGRRFGYDAYE